MKTTGDIRQLTPQQPSVIDVYRSPKLIHGLARALNVPPAVVQETVYRLASELEAPKPVRR